MLKKLLIISLSIFMLIVLAISIYVHNSFKKVKVIKMPSSNAELGISNAAGNDVYDELDELDANNVKKNTNLNEIGNFQITNIALFGLDRRNVDDASRSDCIMILSMDEAAKAIKISSIMRDTYVSVYNHGMTKITHAYAYGGPADYFTTMIPVRSIAPYQ